MIKNLTIKVLATDCAGQKGLLGEVGLSMLIEFDGRKILFDTGQGLALKYNSNLLKINLHDIESIVLSHGHWDHTSGLAMLSQMIESKKVYLHPDAFLKRYIKTKNELREVEIPFSRNKLEEEGIFFTNAEPIVILAQELSYQVKYHALILFKFFQGNRRRFSRR